MLFCSKKVSRDGLLAFMVKASLHRTASKANFGTWLCMQVGRFELTLYNIPRQSLSRKKIRPKSCFGSTPWSREDFRGVAGVAVATPFFQVLFHKLGPKFKKKIL